MVQWAKVLWATNGDKNSKFFHNHATQRKQKNSIHKIRHTFGQWRSGSEDTDKCLIDYYQELFTLAHLQNSNAATNSISFIISVDMYS